MVALSLHRWLPRPGLTGLLLLLWAAGAGQAPATEIHYLKDLSFRIPFVINPAQQRLIRQVALYVSEDEGRSYKVYANAQPAETSFLFHALHQGWYWFTVQAQYLDGHNMPADPMTGQPGLKICVDSIAPTVVLRQTQSRDGLLGVEWDIRDENPDLMSVHLDYRPVGALDWIPLSQAPSVLYNQFGWTPTVNATQYEVRLQVRDRAGNAAEKVVQLAPGGPRPQPPPDPVMGGPNSSPGNKITYLNSRSIKLNFDLDDVGKSKVKIIEVWRTTTTRDWKKSEGEEQAPREDQRSLMVTAPGEGRFGYTLIARSHVGRGVRPPAVGEQPDFWVEVDTTPPVVQILNTEVSGTPEDARLTISWKAQDKNMAAQPITLSYLPVEGDPSTGWKIIESGYANIGRYVWPTKDVPHDQFFIKVEAVDLAGNMGSAKTNEAVIVDLHTPKARIKDVEKAPGAAPMQPGAYAPQPSAPMAAIEPDPQLRPVGATVAPVAPPTTPAPTPPSAPAPAPVAPPAANPPTPSTVTPVAPTAPSAPSGSLPTAVQQPPQTVPPTSLPPSGTPIPPVAPK